MNMNEQDMIELTGGCCSLSIISCLLRNIFLERAAHSKGAMIVSLFFTVEVALIYTMHVVLRGYCP